ncbi:probable leucine-rich repeat receptor-like serine/threonine-protein kinase At3g14840, partial [Arabidopsis lyrata subsp. lyrata]|uniref:probable leucine-rich repeat receptor-like serine/threonine-protein kinase At3g14840 n=1 Tax=Arabidopsis lyrata subsp. lyrata TaxID=81972 RepID=UPI000A29B72A
HVPHLWKQNKVAQFVDPRLQSHDKDEVMRTINIGIICTSRAYADMSPMLAVVSMLECPLTAEVEAHMTVLSDEEHALHVLRMIAEIDEEFESQEITLTLERYHISRKGKENVSYNYFPSKLRRVALELREKKDEKSLCIDSYTINFITFQHCKIFSIESQIMYFYLETKAIER